MNNGQFRCPCISSPPLDHHGPLPMSPGGHYQHCDPHRSTFPNLPNLTNLIISLSCCFQREALLTEAFHLQSKETGRNGEWNWWCSNAKQQTNKLTSLWHCCWCCQNKTVFHQCTMQCTCWEMKWNGKVSGCACSSSHGNKTTTYHAGPTSFQIQCLQQQSCNTNVWEGWGRIERQG